MKRNKEANRKNRNVIIALTVLAILTAIWLTSILTTNPYLSPRFPDIDAYFVEAQELTEDFSDNQIIDYLNTVVPDRGDPILIGLYASLTYDQAIQVTRGTNEGRNTASTWTNRQQSAVLSLINDEMSSEVELAFRSRPRTPSDDAGELPIRIPRVPDDETITFPEPSGIQCNGYNNQYVKCTDQDLIPGGYRRCLCDAPDIIPCEWSLLRYCKGDLVCGHPDDDPPGGCVEEGVA